MCGRATFATEVSSTSITVASMTEIAMSQGLKLGTHCCGGGVSDSAIGPRLPHLDSRLDGHSRYETLYLFRRVVKNDLYRHTLNDLDIIACRHFGGQDA